MTETKNNFKNINELEKKYIKALGKGILKGNVKNGYFYLSVL